MLLLVPISVGELLDKISILELKAEAIADPAKRANVTRELAALEAVRRREIAAAAPVPAPALDALDQELRAVNRTLWRAEDALRRHESEQRFDAAFIALARSIYHENDRRAAIKRRINELTGSELVEEKSYRPV
jgi:hypothetical protein